MKATQPQHFLLFFDHLSKFFHHDKKIIQHPPIANSNNKSEFFNSLSTTKDGSCGSSEFLTAIVHELKTPLNAIMGFSEVLQKDIHDPKCAEECLEYAEEISRAAFDLDELIHDILDAGAGLPENFSVDLSKEIDVADVIKRSARLNYNYSLKRKISLNVEIADGVKMINLDLKRMKQVMNNLISNAIKYSPECSEVFVIAKNIEEKSKKYLEILVSDHGFGMTKEQIKIAFQKYSTIPNPNTGKVDSLGLGLPITKQLIELQNGTFTVESKPNKGTTIALRFPYKM